jgi:hypothetical protein
MMKEPLVEMLAEIREDIKYINQKISVKKIDYEIGRIQLARLIRREQALNYALRAVTYEETNAKWDLTKGES